MGRRHPVISGRSEAIVRLHRQLDRLSGCDIAVLLQGETGCGKELTARAIHDEWATAGAPFVAVNCAAISESLQESELFGHERGAFTGATHRLKGRFEQADGGTLFLDEIADLSPRAQGGVLRVLQEKVLTRLGGDGPVGVAFRLLAASNVDLYAAVAAGRFRQDLFYRIAVYEIDVPPLRERAVDIPALVAFFGAEFVAALGGAPAVFEPEALDAMVTHAWPGNLRELQNVVQRAILDARPGAVRVQHLPRRVREVLTPRGQPGRGLVQVEKEAILAALARTGGNRSRAAVALGISRKTLYRRLRSYD